MERQTQLLARWGSKLSYRPRVSVCIATYQGSRYVALQLRSILPQLSPDDEIVITDDGSTDKTCAEILSLSDPRISLTCSPSNRGLLRSFETSISRATGDIVFLSDQDDLWLPCKVETVLAVFAKDPSIMLTASDAILIDQHGDRLSDSYYKIRGRFCENVLSNLMICSFLGCTMAFRSQLLQWALPFPESSLIYHDVWLGCVNSLARGKTKYIPQPLVAYRRHANSVTAARRSLYQRLRVRLQLSLALMRFGLTAVSR
jgi:glycosyltransferase involved in cell wall biosynthesis